MKKSLIISAMISMMLLTACGGKGGNSGGNSDSTSAGPTYEITINENTITVAVDGSKDLVAASNVTGVTIVWSSADETIATVDQNGKVTGKAEGTTRITASIEGREEKVSCEVTVVGNYIVQEPTEITVQTTFNDTYAQVFKDAIASLAKKEPNLTVNYSKYSGDYTMLKEAIISGFSANNFPDVAVAYPDSVADFINSGRQLRMDRIMNDEEVGWTAAEKADFYEAYLVEGAQYAVEGTYSLPIAKSTEGMYYDEEKLIGINLAPIDPTINGGNAITASYLDNLTWDELFNKLCPALLQYRDSLPTEEQKKAFLDTTDDWAILGYDSGENLFITLAEQYGYEYTSVNQVTGHGEVKFNNDGMKALMKTFNAAAQKKYIATKGTLGTAPNKLFTEDKVLLSVGSTGGVGYQFSQTNPKNVRVARIPQAPGKDPKVIQQGPSLAFLQHNDNKENRRLGAWLFYKELTSVQNCIVWATTTGYSPIRKSVAKSDDFLDFSDPSDKDPKTVDRLKAYNVGYQASVSNYLYSSPVFKGSSDTRVYVGSLTTDIFTKADITDAEIDAFFQKAYDNSVLAIEGKTE